MNNLISRGNCTHDQKVACKLFKIIYTFFEKYYMDLIIIIQETQK